MAMVSCLVQIGRSYVRSHGALACMCFCAASHLMMVILKKRCCITQRRFRFC